jgi:hypothetical protein
MTKKPQTSKDAAEKVVKNIRRKTRQTYSAVSQPSLVRRHHLPADAAWVFIFGRHHGLAHAQSACVAHLKHAGSRVLF